MKIQPSIRDVLQQLQIQTPEPAFDGNLRVAAVQTPPQSAWYIRLFAGLGAWIAALLFLTFLGIFGLLENEIAMIVVGLGLSAGAVALHRGGSTNDFVRQLAFSGSLVAQGMVTFGVGQLTKNINTTALIVIVFEIVLLFAYNDHVHRIFSTWAVIAAVLIVAVFEPEQYNLIHGVIAGLAVIVTAISAFEPRLMLGKQWPLIDAIHDSVGIAFVVLLLMTLAELPIRWWWLSALVIMGLALFAGGRIVTELGINLSPKVAIAGAVLLLGLTVMSLKIPGLMGAVLLLMLGFWRSNRLFLGIGMVFGLVYVVGYYYTLQTTLLAKSLLMFGTGAIILLLRWLLIGAKPVEEAQ